MNTLRTETANLHAEVTILQQALQTPAVGHAEPPQAAAPVQPTPPTPPTTSFMPKISLPDKWKGKDVKCDVFLTSLSLVFEFQSLCYPSDRSRIALLSSLLTGQAVEWAAAVLRANTTTAHNHETFTQQLKAAFQYPGSEVVVDSCLYHLR